MRLLLAVVLLGVTLSFCGGCSVRAPVVPPLAAVYSNVKAPIDVELDSTPMESKRGESSTVTILGLVSFGDAGIKAAADQGGLQTIESADYSYFNILYIFQKFTTIVYGK